MRPETAQEQQDEILANRDRNAPTMSREEFSAMVEAASPKQKNAGSSPEESSTAYDPIANAMRRHPGLTRGKAEAMAEAFGF